MKRHPDTRHSIVKIVLAVGLLLALLPLLSSDVGAALAPGGWNAAGGMSLPRADHTASLLPNGSMLVVGGVATNPNGVQFFPTATERYDPATGQWSAGPHLGKGRSHHTATTLADGRVLVVGGRGSVDGSSAITDLTTAEVYDPAANNWQPAGRLMYARSEHVAVLLPDGTVLVVGGRDFVITGDLNWAEIYDPVAGTWRLIDDGLLTYQGYAATLLADGNVLVTGGPDGTAAVFDTATESWHNATPMGRSRKNHTATLLPDGTVLVAGGSDYYPDTMLVAMADVELYDPHQQSWSSVGSMTSSRTEHTATLLRDGTVLVAGGYDAGGQALATAERFDPDSRTWLPDASMRSARFTHTAVLLRDGAVLVAGGRPTGGDITRTAERYTAVPEPAAVLYPQALAFGGQRVGTSSAAQTVKLANTGMAPLAIHEITVSGDFAQTNTCGASLAPEMSCTISVTFSPTARGARSGTLSVADDAAYSPQTVSLSGTGTEPAVSLKPTSFSFGGQKVGTTSAAWTVTLTNSGGALLTITNIYLGDGMIGADDFAQTNTCLPAPGATGSLAPGASCTINVTFRPSATGLRSGTLMIVDDAPGSPHMVSFSGTGTLPAVSLSPSSLAFGEQKVGTTSPAQPVTLTNSGDAVLAISNIHLGDGTVAALDFAQTNTCGASLAPRASCTINVTFRPSASGLRSGLLTIVDDAGGSPHTVPVSGTGTVPAVSLSSSSLVFSGQKVGTTSPAKIVTLTNTGQAELLITSVSISGDFAWTTTCAASLAPGANCTINVTFTPTATGTRTGTLTIASDAAGSPHAVTLSGTGQRKR